MRRTIPIYFLLFLRVSFSYAQHSSLTWKKLNLTSPALEQIGQLATLPAKDLGESSWSIGCETLDRGYAEFANYKQYIGELGIASARIQSGWARTEPQKGKYDFSWLDEVVDGLAAQNVKPWVCLCYGNPIYGANKGLGSVIFSDESTLKAWDRYVEKVVERYKNKINEWEVWNEPNLGNNAQYPLAYAELLARTATLIRKIQPQAVIIGFGLSRMPLSYTSTVLNYLKDRNQLSLLNYVSFHPYLENPDDAAEGIQALADLVSSYSPNIKLWQGECGCPAILEWGHALRYHEWTEFSQAKWVLRRMVNDWSMGIKSSVFTLADLQYPNMLQSFGLIRMNLLKKPVYKRPSFHAVQHAVNLLSKQMTSGGRLECESNSTREIAAVQINKNTKCVGALFWYADRIPSDNLNWDFIELKVKNFELTDPVFVDLLTGRVFALPNYYGTSWKGSTKFPELPMWDSPIAIIERSALKLTSPISVQSGKGSTKDMLY